MTARYLYLFNIIASSCVGYIGYQRDNSYILLSCLFTFIVSLFCFITTFRLDLQTQNLKNIQSETDTANGLARTNNISTITKAIVNKTHGGRKLSKKYWGAATAYTQIPINSDQNISNDVTKKATNNSFRKYVLSSWSLVILLTVTLVSGGFILIPPYLEDKKTEIPVLQASSLRPKANKNIINNKQPRKLNVTNAQLKKAMSEIAREKKAKQSNEVKPVGYISKPPFQYEIELNSGDVIYADHIKSSGDEVTGTSNTGLVFTVSTNRVKSIKLARDNY